MAEEKRARAMVDQCPSEHDQRVMRLTETSLSFYFGERAAVEHCLTLETPTSDTDNEQHRPLTIARLSLPTRPHANTIVGTLSPAINHQIHHNLHLHIPRRQEVGNSRLSHTPGKTGSQKRADDDFLAA